MKEIIVLLLVFIELRKRKNRFFFWKAIENTIYLFIFYFMNFFYFNFFLNLKLMDYVNGREYGNVSKDILIQQLKNHIMEMEQNEKIFERLNNKFTEMQEE